MQRHIGKLINTDSRIAVVYMQIPNAEDYALIVQTDALPDAYHDHLMKIIENEGQHDLCLADTLGRISFGDMGRNGLEVLHYAGALRREPITNVMMYPEPNQGIKLTELLKLMGKTTPTSRVDKRVDENFVEYKDTVYSENAAVSENTGKVNIAKNLLIEAKMLDDDANARREKAYALCPELRPQQRSAPVVRNVAPVQEDAPAPKVAAQKGTKATKAPAKVAETVPAAPRRGRPKKV